MTVADTIPDAPSAWRSYQDEKGYKVFKRPEGAFKYTVTRDGSVVQVASTLWGARRAIRKDRQRQRENPFWENPVVLEEES